MKFPQDLFTQLYGDDNTRLAVQKARYEALAEHWYKRFGADAKSVDSQTPKLRFFSSPGRSEIGGNHTDHNLGKVLAASIDQDCIAAVQASDDNIVSIYDITYNKDFGIDTSDTAYREGESGSESLIRGMLQGFKNAGYKTGGFKACVTSDVIRAAGVSSSASFEMLICLILNNLYNEGKIPLESLPAIGQFAENAYWHKKSGLLDQTACAVGGLIAIDFKEPEKPLIEKVNFDFAKEGYELVIVNTGSGHADLSEEYSAIPAEMKAAASALGKTHLRELSFEDVYNQVGSIRKKCGDRAVLRALHFFEENRRVDAQIACLKTGDFTGFLKLIEESGNSSWKWLQNICVSGISHEQPVALCLALTERFLREKGCGACRVHGGGFAGVIQVFIPSTLCAEYRSYMEKALGFDEKGNEKSPVFVMNIRPVGAVEIPV
ncbi:galactokinase family protein [Treponema sp. HNW]|uniref:galactokinase n=1 Tax=Treponema sp. HNW TaxID=3116654 RepID=UPI003D14EB05